MLLLDLVRWEFRSFRSECASPIILWSTYLDRKNTQSSHRYKLWFFHVVDNIQTKSSSYRHHSGRMRSSPVSRIQVSSSAAQIFLHQKIAQKACLPLLRVSHSEIFSENPACYRRREWLLFPTHALPGYLEGPHEVQFAVNQQNPRTVVPCTIKVAQFRTGSNHTRLCYCYPHNWFGENPP